MRRFLQVMLTALGLCSGCSKSGVLTPAQFTKEYADELRKASPGLRVEVLRDLELKVTSTDGHQSTSFLHNSYDCYRQDPKAKAETLARFVAANLETPSPSQEPVDRTRIVPIVKDRPWLEETRQALLDRGAKEVPEHVYEDLNRDLVILYAQDSPKNIRYLSPEDLETARVERKQLRVLACENLKRSIPKIERHGENGLYMITAGGDYEASLLLLDSIWDGMQMGVNGDIVVAIPTRDLLLVTGSRDPQGIAKLKQMIEKAYSEGSYRLTPKLFVRHNGVFEEFNGGQAETKTAG